jgi:nucleoside-diphosphate-sugar epimerase
LRNDAGSPHLDDYRNTYEWSKAHAERVARKTFAHLTVVRPPLITGRLSDGRAARFSGIYTLVRGMTIGTLPAIVAEPDAPFDAIPVDKLGRIIIDLITGHHVGYGTTTLTIAAGPKAPSVKEAITAVVDALNRWRRLRDRGPLEPLPLISPDTWNRFFWPFIKDHLSARQAMVLDLLRSFEPYLALAAPLSPDYTIDDVLPSLAASTRYWADTNPRIAAHSPRPWRAEHSNAPLKFVRSARREGTENQD